MRNVNDFQIDRRAQIDILLEEYRSLNRLLLFRLAAMDRRLPVTVGFFTLTAVSLVAVPHDLRIAILLVTPLGVSWFVRTTAQHARAKEDHLRRIDEIERLINSLAGAELLVFQSRHPNRLASTSGRTGQVTMTATACSGIFILFFCVVLLLREASFFPAELYVVYVTGIVVDVVLVCFRLLRYGYQKSSASPPDIAFVP